MTFFVARFDQLSDDEIQKLVVLRDEGHEIACHGMNHIDAVQYAVNHTFQDYLDTEILPAIDIMNDYGFSPVSFCYPYGSRNSTLDTELSKYFEVLRGTKYTSNTTRIVDKDSIYYNWLPGQLVNAVGVDNKYGNTLAEIVEGMERVNSTKEVLLLYGHTPANDSGDYITPLDKLESIFQIAKDMGLSFFRVCDLQVTLTDFPTTPTETTPNVPKLNEIVLTMGLTSTALVVLWAIIVKIFPSEENVT
jgi:peptidoglycan/xylan/chitin deacetylase (PgdA/CDA1 family)